MSITVLSGHTSAETAYVVDDYPYGFRLRCKIRYWIETHPRHGSRFMSQTSNPKKGGVWNKPKGATYSRFGEAMYLDDNGHVQHAGLTEYTDGAEASAWRDTYGAGVSEEARPLMNKWVEAKLAYDRHRAAGDSMGLAGAKASIEVAQA